MPTHCSDSCGLAKTALWSHQKKMPSILIRHCRAICADHVLTDAAILIKDGLIKEIGADAEVRAEAATIIDAQGQYVAPGFVDVHCHGDGKNRFFDEPEIVSKNLLQQGTTTVLATLGYSDMKPGQLDTQLRQFRQTTQSLNSSNIAGIHMEGPYVNPKYGAQTNRGVIKDPETNEYRAWLDEFDDLIKWWTCAPELPGAIPFIETSLQHGGVVGAGHSEATAEQMHAAIDAGLRVVTHWTNATGNPTAAQFRGTRYPGIDEVALVSDELTAEIIPDEKGLHVHPIMAQLLYKAKGPERIMIITDAGYSRDDDPVETGEPRDVSIDGNGDLAGSRLTMPGACRNFRRFTDCSWPELFRMAALNPAGMLGLDQEIGSLEPGKHANLILFDDDLNVSKVCLRGSFTEY